MACTAHGTFVYADLDQRTLETGRALIEGACGASTALPLFHDADTGPGVNDPLFDGSDWLSGTDKIDGDASRAAVAATLPSPIGAVVTQHAGEFATLQRILNGRCSGACTPASAGDSVISVSKKGLAELVGPLDIASGYAESLFLETAQCGPEIAPSDLETAMKVHVLAYDVNARNSYNAWVKGGNILAHIVALLAAKAGEPSFGVDSPIAAGTSVVILSGHDTQLGALGGILDAHWSPGNGLASDDMPPGSALVFGLYRTSAGAYVVRTTFVSESLAQMRSDSPVAGGITASVVTQHGCDEGACALPLGDYVQLARHAMNLGFVKNAWTPSSDAAVALPALRDPPWTRCN
jgi:4-phytase/acid phosphatase